MYLKIKNTRFPHLHHSFSDLSLLFWSLACFSLHLLPITCGGKAQGYLPICQPYSQPSMDYSLIPIVLFLFSFILSDGSFFLVFPVMCHFSLAFGFCSSVRLSLQSLFTLFGVWLAGSLEKVENTHFWKSLQVNGCILF